MKFWNFQPDPEMPEDGYLDVDGEIVAEEGWFGGDGVCVARNFRRALGGMRNVTVRINSPGGDVLAGAEIYSALREHSLNGHGKITVIVTALAASAASIIAMAGDKILMSPTAYMMIHNPWTVAIGDAKEMRKTAKTLDEIGKGLINAYRIKTGKSEDELKRMLENETWMSAVTAIEEGFADGMVGADSQDEDEDPRQSPGKARVAACLMSGKSHGSREILQRMSGKGDTTALFVTADGIQAEIQKAKKAEKPEEDDPEEGEEPKEPEEPEEDDPEEGEEPEEKPEKARKAKKAKKAEKPEEDDPEEDDPEEGEEPEEEKPEEPEEGEEPEEDDPEEGEEEEELEKKKQALLIRSQAALIALDAWMATVTE